MDGSLRFGKIEASISSIRYTKIDEANSFYQGINKLCWRYGNDFDLGSEFPHL